jgi:arylformamidase
MLFGNGVVMDIFDITIPLSAKTPVWEGDQGVTITLDERISDGADFNVSRMEMGVHAGTHIDAPFHLFAQGQTVDQIPLDKLVGKAQVIRIPGEIGLISADVLKTIRIEKEISRILFRTRNSIYWREEPCQFRRDFTALDASAVEYLVSLNIKLVGIDWFSISPLADLKRPHEILLKAGVVILENVDLGNIEPGIYDLYCLPLNLVGTDGAPVRAILTRE